MNTRTSAVTHTNGAYPAAGPMVAAYGSKTPAISKKDKETVPTIMATATRSNRPAVGSSAGLEAGEGEVGACGSALSGARFQDIGRIRSHSSLKERTNKSAAIST